MNDKETNMNSHSRIGAYFHAEERGDIEAVVALCAEDVIVRNAANPPQHGKEGARAYVDGTGPAEDA